MELNFTTYAALVIFLRSAIICLWREEEESMKRLSMVLALVMALAMTLSLVACGGKTEEQAPAANAEAAAIKERVFFMLFSFLL